jgi:hypothetical protein
MTFTRITGDQKQYVIDGEFSIVADYDLASYDADNYVYCKVGEDLVHVPTFYNEMGNPKGYISELTAPKPHKPCVRRKRKPKPKLEEVLEKLTEAVEDLATPKVKIEVAELRKQVEEYIKQNGGKTMTDLIKYLEKFYRRDMTDYMEVIRSCKWPNVKRVLFLTWINELDPEYGGDFRMAFRIPSGLKYINGDYAGGILQMGEWGDVPEEFHPEITKIVSEKVIEQMKQYNSD